MAVEVEVAEEGAMEAGVAAVAATHPVAAAATEAEATGADTNPSSLP